MVQGPQSFTLVVAEEPGPDQAPAEVAAGRAYPALAPDEAAATAAALGAGLAAALAHARNEPVLAGLRAEVRCVSSYF